ncbi:SPOR domain-containing protein [Luteimonas sp. 50]|uniref:SPOR domain-containing protein n=2 Tax=Cognatiluteimonas sedimenti TaxID=2927791 RepID=A0ABT0A762_9GAMM|nr:SPOR domain-containing protein [Lysobacter sedimenti]
MRSRRARVATGKPGTPDPRAATGRVAASAVAANRASAPATSAPSVPSPVPATPTPAANGTTARAVGGLVLQVASFAAHDNAERALAMVNGAGIAGARLLDADANGRRVWRLRVGPVDPSSADDLVARIQGLGFGQPQRVRE